MKIVVLTGGLSTERDVSLKTGEMVAGALRDNGHQALLLDAYLGYGVPGESLEEIVERAATEEAGVSEITEEAPDIAAVRAKRADCTDGFFGPNVMELCQMADLVFIALHGENGEDGRIQAAFDLFGVRYTGSGYKGSALAMDKGIAKQLFLSGNIPTPHGMLLKKKERPKLSELTINFPCIIKPCCGGSSIGISIAADSEELKQAVDAAFLLEDCILLEDYIEGREFSVSIIDGKALPVIEIAPVKGFYDYRNKYTKGGAVETCPADLLPEIANRMQEYAKRASEVLGLATYSRTDFLLNDKNEIFCLEVNTLPGMTPTSLLPQEANAVGIDFHELCELLIKVSLKKYEEA